MVYLLFHRYPPGLFGVTQQPAPYHYRRTFSSLAGAQRGAEEDFAYMTKDPQDPVTGLFDLPRTGPAESLRWDSPRAKDHPHEHHATSTTGGYPLFTVIEDDLVD